jgi:protein SCO1
MKNKTSIRLFVVLVFIIPLVAFAAMNWYEKKFSPLPVIGPQKNEAGIINEHKITSFSLVNQEGQRITMSGWKDRIVIADFFFTHCPSICPAMTKNLQKVQAVYKGDKELLINSFSVDPERDSAAQLKSYARRMKLDNANWELLTGDKKEIYRLARNSFMVVATDGDGGPGDFIHSDKIVLIDQQKRIRGYYSGTDEKEMDQLILDIKKLKDEN